MNVKSLLKAPINLLRRPRALTERQIFNQIIGQPHEARGRGHTKVHVETSPVCQLIVEQFDLLPGQSEAILGKANWLLLKHQNKRFSFLRRHLGSRLVQKYYASPRQPHVINLILGEENFRGNPIGEPVMIWIRKQPGQSMDVAEAEIKRKIDMYV